MLVSRLILGFVAAASAVSCAAQNDIWIGSVVTSEQIREWLAGDDLRLVAWGAYFASRSQDAINDPVFVTMMARRMARWVEQYHGTPSQVPHNVVRDRRKAMQSILYALIEEGASVPIGSLIPVETDFPTEALILAARLPGDDLSRFLRYGCDENRGLISADENWRHTTACTPVAAMLLAKAPPPGFAAIVLNEPREELSFWVLDEDWELSKMKGDEGGIPGCKDTRKDEPITRLSEAEERELSRWPPLFTYVLQDSASPYPGTLLVDAGGLTVTYRRIPVFTRSTGCYPPPVDFSEDLKHHLLAEMLETGDDSIAWRSRQEVAFFLRNPADFLPALNKQIELEESRFREMVQTLEDKGYLTKDEATKIPLQLLVIVNDARASVLDGQSHAPPPLPEFVSTAPLISVAYDKR